MRKVDVQLTFDDFTGRLRWYQAFIDRVCRGRIVRAADERMELLEAFLIRIHTLWDRFGERLLIDCLNRDTSQYAEHTDRNIRKHLSRDECAALLEGLGYLDFKSVGNMKGIARKVLLDRYNPFKTIPDEAGRRIDELYQIRNYLAHGSNQSKRALRKAYKDGWSAKRFTEPGSFLMHKDRATGKPRFSSYTDALVETASEMGLFLGIYK